MLSLLYDESGIEVKSQDDILKVIIKLERKIDKFNENFPINETDSTPEKITLMEMAGSYQSFMESPINGISRMTVTELIVLKKQVDKKHEAQLKQQQLIESMKNR